MPIAKQPAARVGLLEITATIGLVAGAVWLAARNTNAAIRRLGRHAEESAVLAEVRANRARIEDLAKAAYEGGYAGGYADGLDGRAPQPPRQLRGELRAVPNI